MMDELNDLLTELSTGVSVTGDDDRIIFTIGEDRVSLNLHQRAAVTPSTAFRLIDEHSQPGFVVGDIVHAQAAESLIQAGWSIWDRRGRLRIWLPDFGLRLDMNSLRSFVAGASGPNPANAVTGSGSIAVALALLAAKDPKTVGVREIARTADMNASTISRARSKLIEAALINSDGTPLANELFWATSRAWLPKMIRVDQAPGGNDWILGGDSAAAHNGAAVFGEIHRWYTNDRTAVRRWALRHRDDNGPHEVAVAPTPLVVATATDGIAHPVVAALDLSTTSRGREILASWTTPAYGTAVWV